MAKAKLKPTCVKLAEQLLERAHQQLLAAYPVLKSRGLTHDYSCTETESTGSDIKRVCKVYHDCISSYTCVFRMDEHGELLMHSTTGTWLPLHYGCCNLKDVAHAADYLLDKANLPRW